MKSHTISVSVTLSLSLTSTCAGVKLALAVEFAAPSPLQQNLCVAMAASECYDGCWLCHLTHFGSEFAATCDSCAGDWLCQSCWDEYLSEWLAMGRLPLPHELLEQPTFQAQDGQWAVDGVAEANEQESEASASWTTPPPTSDVLECSGDSNSDGTS